MEHAAEVLHGRLIARGVHTAGACQNQSVLRIPGQHDASGGHSVTRKVFSDHDQRFIAVSRRQSCGTSWYRQDRVREGFIQSATSQVCGV